MSLSSAGWTQHRPDLPQPGLTAPATGVRRNRRRLGGEGEGLILGSCRPSASPVLEEPVHGLFGGGTGLFAFLGRRAAGAGAGGAPAAAQVPRLLPNPALPGAE